MSPDSVPVMPLSIWRPVGSLLKDLKVPARDAQTILGHTRISTTLEIYTDTDEAARRQALTKLHDLPDDQD